MKESVEHSAPKIHGSTRAADGAARNRVFFQSKLTINQPGDVYEREADTVADRVMRMTLPAIGESSFFTAKTPLVQPKCQHCEEERKERLRAKSNVQRKCAECEMEEAAIQRKENGHDTPGVDLDFERYTMGLHGRGNPLSAEERHFFEPRFNRDFSNVRVHTGLEASQSAQHIHSLAYTVGNNIVFNRGQYQPHSNQGRRLMAHELTHVVQQRGLMTRKPIQRKPDERTQNAPDSPLWDYIEVIPECPPRARLLNTAVNAYEIDQELYGGKGVDVSLRADFTFDVSYEHLLPEWKTRFKGCVAPEEEIPAEQEVCRADTEYVGNTEITLGRVSAPKGIRLHTTPDVADCDYVGKVGIAARVCASFLLSSSKAAAGNQA